MTVPSNVGVHSVHSLASSSPNSPSSAFSHSTHYGAFKPVAPKASALPPPNFAARRASMGAQAQLQAQPSNLALAPLHHRQEKAPQSVVHEELYEDEDPYEEEQSYNEIQQQQQQQRVLGGGCWESQGEPMVAASSPWSDRSEYESDELEEYEEEESFDGPLKDQYRGRAWSQGQEQQQPIGVGRTGGWSEPPASDVAYDSRGTSNASMFDQQQHQQQQSNQYQQQQYQQQQAPPPAPSRDLDRLFHGLRLPVPNQQQQASYQPQVVVPPVVKAPVLPPPAPTAASSLVLAPFLTEAVWSLLLNPFASHASDRDSAAVVSDGHGYERVSGGDFGGRDEYWPVTPPTARNGGGVSQGGWRNVKAAAWEDERWSNDPYSPHSNQLQTPPALTLDDFSSSPYQPAPPALRRNPYMLSTSAPPTSFTRFAHQTLAQTLIQPTGVMLALWYISRSPIHEGGGEEGRKFRDALRNCGDGATGEEIAKRVLTLSLAWANKWLEDNTYTNRSWSDVTRIPIAEINNLELLALSTMSFDLSVSVTEWATWINRLYTSTDDSVVRSALVEMSDSLASAEHKRSFEPRGRDYKDVQAAQKVSVVEAMDVSPVRIETPVRPAVVVAPSTWGTGYSSSSSSMNSTASSIPRKSLSSTSHTNIWGEFGQQQRSSSITGYNHLHHPQQQRHSLAQSYNNGSYASSRSSRASMSSYYNASAARGNGVTLPSVQQGFGTRGWEMMGTGGGMVPMAQTTTCW